MDDFIRREDAIAVAMDYQGQGNAQDASQDIAAGLSSIQAATPADIIAGMWVSVTERLPEDGRWCIIFVTLKGTYCNQRIARYDGEGIFTQHDGVEWNTKEDDITHWMPLPEPPKEVET